MTHSSTPSSRRGFMAGTVTIGAAAAAVTALPYVRPTDSAAAQAPLKPKRGGGYRLSEHVKRYYKTTLV